MTEFLVVGICTTKNQLMFPHGTHDVWLPMMRSSLLCINYYLYHRGSIWWYAWCIIDQDL